MAVTNQDFFTAIETGYPQEVQTEFKYLDVTPGTAEASKALVLDASKGIATITSATITTLTCTTLILGGNTMSGTELGYVDGITPGTVETSKAVVVNATKDAGDFRNLDCVNLDAGSSGAAGTVDVFPSTASKGKLSFSAADNTGDTVTTVTNAAMADTRTLTIPEPGVSAATFAMRSYALAAAGAALTGSAAETDLGTVSLAANTIKAGTVIRIRYQGIATAQAGSTTLTVKLKIGSTVLLTHAAHAVAANDIFCGEFTLVGRAAPGAAAACVGWGLFGPTADDFDQDGTLGMQAKILASTNLATNGALAVAVTGQWGGADASSCRLDVMTVEVL